MCDGPFDQFQMLAVTGVTGDHGEDAAWGLVNATEREHEDASIFRAQAVISKRIDAAIMNVLRTAIPCAKVVWITQMASKQAENVVRIEIHVHMDKQTATEIWDV